LKILVIGDLQIDCADSTSKRSEQTQNTLCWLLSLIASQQPGMLVHLGDFGEDNRGVDHRSLGLMTWFLAEVFKSVPTSYWLVGNHDFCTEDGSVNLMSSLGRLFSPSHQVVWPWCNGPEGTSFVSYLGEGNKERWRAEAGLVFSEFDKCVLFSHLPVKGGMFGPNRFDGSGLDPDCFPKTTVVGHYHKPNPPDLSLGWPDKTIWYCGAPMSHDFRDNCYGLLPSQQLRGVWVFDVVRGELQSAPTFIENPYSHYYVSFSTDVSFDAACNVGYVHDSWFNCSRRVPLERTHLRLTVPTGKEVIAELILKPHVHSLTLLSEASALAGVASSIQIDPNSTPESSICDYVDSLADSRLNGLGRDDLKKDGISLVQGTYNLPIG